MENLGINTKDDPTCLIVFYNPLPNRLNSGVPKPISVPNKKSRQETLVFALFPVWPMI